MDNNNMMPELTLTPFADKPVEKPAEPEVPAAQDAEKDLGVTLTPEEKNMVADFAAKIDITDPNIVLQYGAGSQQKIANFSDSALQNVKTKDLGEVGDMITSLVGELRDFEAPKIEEYLDKRAHDTFHVSTLTPDDFRDTRQRGVLGMVPGEIITTDNGYADHVDLEKDILKIAVVERHKGTHHIGLGYIQGYGLKSGAVATSISHDSHNIIVVGTNSADMAFAANYIVEHHGGIVVVENGTVKGSVVLEIAGIMSDRPLTEVNDQLEAAKAAAFELGVSRGIDPFMTLSFMALPVIPTLRITTRGIIDVVTQQYI